MGEKLFALIAVVGDQAKGHLITSTFIMGALSHDIALLNIY